MINATRDRLSSVHDSMEEANRAARRVWDQFDPRGISDEVITCDEPDKPYDVFKCVNDNACSVSVSVQEMYLSSLRVDQIKQIGYDYSINLDGCKRKKEFINEFNLF